MSKIMSRMKTNGLLPALVVSLLLIGVSCQQSQPDFDVLIKGGQLLDGTGSPAQRADLGIRGDAIVDVGDFSASTAKQVIDATGLVVAPGFIDMHSHSDFPLLVDGRALGKVMQGVTTELLGESDSPAPAVGPARPEMERSLAGMDLKLDWTTLGEYFARLERQKVAVNVVSLVASGQVRAAVVGYEDRAPTPEELKRMEQLVDDAMRDGAVGLSSGLLYAPNSYAKTEEIIALAKVAGRRGGIYVTHLRNENEELLKWLQEAARIGQEGGLPVEVLHLKRLNVRLDGAREAGGMAEALAYIEDLQKKGVKIAADAYPYIASSTSLTARLVPRWALDGGRERFVARLRDPAQRKKIQAESQKILSSPIAGLRSDTVMLARTSYEPHRQYQGKRLSEIGDLMKTDTADALLTILDKGEGQASGVFFGMREEDVQMVLSRPWVTIGSDGSALAPTGILARSHPHPRSYGTYPRVRGKYVRENKTLTLPDAIRKMTSLPAERLGISDRGQLKPGYKADVVVFNAETIIDKSTFDQPHQLSEGVQWLLVNGEVVVSNGGHTGALPGRVLRHSEGGTVSRASAQ
ncbi:MAG: amidohydrolase family protein [Candidatus Korobacteraceae bacterium]